MAFDTDPHAAAATRKRMFDMVTTTGSWSPGCTCISPVSPIW